MPDWVVCRTFSYQHEAEVARSVLAGSGIDSTTSSDDCGALDPALGLVRGIKLLVPADALDLAERLLGAKGEGESADRPVSG